MIALLWLMLLSMPASAASITPYELTLPPELVCDPVAAQSSSLDALIASGAIQIYDHDRQLVPRAQPPYRKEGGVMIGSYTLRPDRSVDHRKLTKLYGPIRPTEHYSVQDMLRSFSRIGFEAEVTPLSFRVTANDGPMGPFSVVTPAPSIGMDGVVGFNDPDVVMVFYYEETARDLGQIMYERLYIDIPQDVIRKHPVFAALKVDGAAIERAVAFIRIAPDIAETRRRKVRALNTLFGHLTSAFGFSDLQDAPSWTKLPGWSQEELCYLGKTYGQIQ